jgi:hypothetical protein
MRSVAVAALAASAAAQMPLNENMEPKFGEMTFDPSDYPVGAWRARRGAWEGRGGGGRAAGCASSAT